MKGDHLVVRAGVKRWDMGAGASPGWGQPWTWLPACCSGSPVKDASSSFLLQSRSSGGAVAFDGLRVVGVVQVPRLSFSGNVSENIPKLLVLPGACQVLSSVLQETIQWIHGRRPSGPPPNSARGFSAAQVWGGGGSPLWRGHSLFTFCDGHLSISMHFTPGYYLLREEIFLGTIRLLRLGTWELSRRLRRHSVNFRQSLNGHWSVGSLDGGFQVP